MYTFNTFNPCVFLNIVHALAWSFSLALHTGIPARTLLQTYLRPWHMVVIKLEEKLCTYKSKWGWQTADEDETCVCEVLVDKDREEGDAFESRAVAEGSDKTSTGEGKAGSIVSVQYTLPVWVWIHQTWHLVAFQIYSDSLSTAFWVTHLELHIWTTFILTWL